MKINETLSGIKRHLVLNKNSTEMQLTTFLFFSFLLILTSCTGQTSHSKNTFVRLKETTVKGDTVKELGSNIMVIYQDKKNTYWFGSWETGVYRYDGKTLINYTTKHGLYSNRVDDIKEDNSGNIYFAGMNANSTLTKFDGTSFSNIVATPSNEWKLSANDFWLINAYQAKQKVYRFDGNTFYELTLPKPSKYNNPFDVYTIYKDIKGNVWFGTNPVGVCRYDGKSFDWITEEDVTEFRNEGANGVRSITEDKNGDFWFNTENRYSIYDSSTLKSNTFYTRHESIGSLDGKNTSGLKEYLSTVRDAKNNLWFVTYRDGVWKYDGRKITHYTVEANLKNITLFSIYKDNNGDLWLGTHENGAYKFNGNTFEQFIP
jgi:sugar lactone lactonase YvrE